MLCRTILSTVPCVGCKGVYKLTVARRDSNSCIAVACHLNGSACVWDLRARKRLHKIKLHSYLAYYCTVIGPKMVTSSSDGTAAVSNWQSGDVLWKARLGDGDWYTIKGAKPPPRGEPLGTSVCAQSELKEGFAVATSDGMLHIFDLGSE